MCILYLKTWHWFSDFPTPTIIFRCWSPSVPPLHESAILLSQVFQLGIGALRDEAICRAHEADSVVQFKKNMFFDSFKVGEFLYVSMIVYVSPSQICWILRASGKLWSPSEYRSDGSVELRHFSWSSCWFSLTCSYLHWFPQCEDMWGPQDI